MNVLTKNIVRSYLYIPFSVDIVGSIIIKSPLENIERITPNIYNVDIGGYLYVYTIYSPLIRTLFILFLLQ